MPAPIQTVLKALLTANLLLTAEVVAPPAKVFLGVAGKLQAPALCMLAGKLAKCARLQCQLTCRARREPPTLADVMAPPLSMLAALVAECLACRKPEIVNAGLQMLSKMDELLQHPVVLQEALGVGQVTLRP